ncbi:tumor necrosis factor receptor superfamily member 16-like [Neopelma chrysocephalum]|uniref:tumor necrosis factor receptor superfamily member 16-like n=1 Tax=Neopelma chrysocephalum TaxID=114329 RepID=UPI000FCD15CB|nr:tumor necrosis factor receptor superfamily member 16-like [Neopelma chrysocephalum]
MRRLLAPLLLLLLSPVPGWGGGCPPCPPGVPRPCDPDDTHTRSPAEEEREEPCPPCPACSREWHRETPGVEGWGGGRDAAAVPVPGGTPPVSGDPRVTPPAPGDPPEPPPGATIPLYCALLAAVVVGLVAYVAFKCWDTCRKKRQLDKARDAGDAGMSPDGEKLRGDSGVFLDTPGPQEPPQHGGAPPEGPPPLPVSPRRQEELERLLELGGTAGDVTSAV